MSAVAELKPKKAARVPLLTAEEIRDAIATAEKSIAWAERGRNQARTELNAILTSRDPDLQTARELREQVASHTADIELAVEQRKALASSLIGAEQREREAAWERGRKVALEEAQATREAVARLKAAIKETVLIYAEIARRQQRFANALRPAEGQLLYPLTNDLAQLLVMNVYAEADGLFPSPRGVFETPWQLRQPGSVADIAQKAEAMISTSLKCFDRPPRTSSPPEAA
jgi:hypothetical protein